MSPGKGDSDSLNGLRSREKLSFVRFDTVNHWCCRPTPPARYHDMSAGYSTASQLLHRTGLWIAMLCRPIHRLSSCKETGYFIRV
jgi:hypothetical protein